MVADLDLKGAKTRHLQAGDILFYEGSPADEMYFLERGTITITKRVLSKSIKLGEVNAGEFISERAVLCESLPRSATAEAHTDCDIIVIDQKMCKKFSETIPPFVQKMIKRMTKMTGRRAVFFLKEGLAIKSPRKKPPKRPPR